MAPKRPKGVDVFPKKLVLGALFWGLLLFKIAFNLIHPIMISLRIQSKRFDRQWLGGFRVRRLGQMEGFSARMGGVGYLRTGIFVVWFKYTDVGKCVVHYKIFYSNDKWSQISVGNKKSLGEPRLFLNSSKTRQIFLNRITRKRYLRRDHDLPSSIRRLHHSILLRLHRHRKQTIQEKWFQE